jgi:hypothetical protein
MIDKYYITDMLLLIVRNYICDMIDKYYITDILLLIVRNPPWSFFFIKIKLN